MNTVVSGRLGEDLAVRFLLIHGHKLLCRNYRAAGYEIDIITRDADGVLTFHEVKSVSHEKSKGYRPEELVHHNKMKRIARAARVYISEHDQFQSFRFSVIGVVRDDYSRIAKIVYLPKEVLSL